MQATRLTLILGSCLLGVATAACDSSESAPDTAATAEPDVPETPFVPPGSAPTPWVEDSPTAKKPAYGSFCRPTTDAVWSAADNGGADDAISLDAATGALTLTVQGAPGEGGLSATLTLEVALPGKSWWKGSGTASWGEPASTADVIDAAFCLSEKVDAGGAADGEFALIVLDSGTHRTIGGTFSLPASVLSATGIDAGNLDIDLR